MAEQAGYIEAALLGLYDAVDRLAAERRRHPTDDLLSRLVTASDGDDRFTTQELRSMVVMLVLGGQDTTRGQLGHAMVRFAAHPAQWTLLAEQPELAAQAWPPGSRAWRSTAPRRFVPNCPVSRARRTSRSASTPTAEPFSVGQPQ